MTGVRASALGVMALAALIGVSGCSFRSGTRAPVEDRGAAVPPPPVVAVDPAKSQPPGFENAGKPGYYTVKPGDRLMRIALDHGQAWRDIARWNNLADPNVIEVGQVLRVIPPVDVAVAVARPVSTPSATPSAVPPAGAASGAARPASAPAAPVAAAPAASGDELSWLWPASGAVVAGFDEARNKGLGIGGNAGDPVLASADGKVVYAGSGLRGYGNLVILKHNNTYLSAYAHNQTLLVKEEQTVRRGQKIAEMGNSDADRVKLHFEIRRQGKPVDPAQLLPTR